MQKPATTLCSSAPTRVDRVQHRPARLPDGGDGGGLRDPGHVRARYWTMWLWLARSALRSSRRSTAFPRARAHPPLMGRWLGRGRPWVTTPTTRRSPGGRRHAPRRGGVRAVCHGSANGAGRSATVPVKKLRLPQLTPLTAASMSGRPPLRWLAGTCVSVVCQCVARQPRRMDRGSTDGPAPFSRRSSTRCPDARSQRPAPSRGRRTIDKRASDVQLRVAVQDHCLRGPRTSSTSTSHSSRWMLVLRGVRGRHSRSQSRSRRSSSPRSS